MLGTRGLPSGPLRCARSEKWLSPVIASTTRPATIVRTSAATLPIVEMLLTTFVMRVPARLIASSTTMSRTKPIVMFVVVTASWPPKTVSTVVTTAVAMTPHAIAAPTKRVRPT